MYDVAIVGAGPAGSTLARLLPDGMRVLLVDRRRLDADRVPEKLCGGLLAPAAQAELARQGLGVPHDVVQGPQLFAVRTFDLPTGTEQLYQRHYLNVDRTRFDRWLLSLVPSSVECVFGWTFVGLERGEGGHLARFTTAAEGSVSVAARLIVGADGAASLVRRLAFPGAQPRRYVALQAEMDAGAGEAHYGALFDERLTDYYGWTVPKGDRVLVGAAFPSGPGSPERFESFIARCRDAGAVRGSVVARGAAPLVRPLLPRDLRMGSAGVALVGEAAGLVSPSSGEGISYALRSGALAASAIGAVGARSGAEAYTRSGMSLGAEVLGKGLKASVIGSPPVRRAVMRAGIGAIRQSGAGDVREAFGL